MLATLIKRTLITNTLKLPRTVLQAASGGRQIIDGNELDAQVQLMLAIANKLAAPKAYQVPIEKARANFEEEVQIVDVPIRSAVETEDRSIQGPLGAIPLRVYRPRGLEKPAPIIVYYHGGGWVIGSIQSHDRVCRLMAEEVGAIVVSVHYRLAPEHKFPAAYDDGFAAFRWVVENANLLGGVSTNVAVAGDSAGGNLSAVISQRARDERTTPPSLQLLIYPSTDTTGSMPSRKTFAAGFLLEKKSLDWFKTQYLPSDIDEKDHRISPLFAKNHENLPKTLLLTAGYDPLRDEGKAYADALTAAGVSVRYQCATGQVHGFWNMGGIISEAHRTLLEVCHYLRLELRKGEK
jgi:acetyl esterase